MEDFDATASSLISDLSFSADFSAAYGRFYKFLDPFNKPKEHSESSKSELVGRLYSFLIEALSIISNRLNGELNMDDSHASYFFKTYILCFNCLDSVSSQISEKSWKSHSLQIHRVRLMHCYDAWRKYEDAEKEGLSVLEFIRKSLGRGRTRNNCGQEVTKLILQVVVKLVKYVISAETKNKEKFGTIWDIVKEFKPLWSIHADAHDKLHRELVQYLSQCSSFLVGELASFDGKLARQFCLETFSEFARLSMNDQMEKICSSLLKQLELDDQLPSGLDILTCVLDAAMVHECQINKSLANFLKVVKNINSHSRRGNSKMPKAGEDTSISKVLLNIKVKLRRLTYELSAEELGSTYKALYFTALNFLCKPLSRLINSEHKDILCGLGDNSLPNIRDAFHQFRHVFLAYGERQRNVYEDGGDTVFAVASAAFTLSYATKQNVEESTNFLKDIIKADWVRANGLKDLFTSLYNVGIVLYEANKSEEATESLKLCCEAAWNRVRKINASSSDGCSSDLLEDGIAGFVREELQEFKELKSRNPKLWQTNTHILLKEKCRFLIAKGMESRACGVEGLNDCIKFLSKAISTLRELYDKSKDARDPICHLLFKAYCLHALCTQEAEPKSEHFIKDIDNALKLWSNQDNSLSAEDMEFQNNHMLLYYVADLISLKDYMVDHSLLYETMIKFSLWKKDDLCDCLALLWQSRRLSHALCASPVNDEFIMTLSNHRTEFNLVEFWTSCMERSKLLVGFRQSLMVISTLSSSHCATKADITIDDITIDEVKQTASDLTDSDHPSDTSLFLAAQLYYDLCERMIARGLMVEALYHGKSAHRLRSKLFDKKFDYSVKKCGYGLETFHMRSSVATTAWSNGLSDFDDGILTPLNILKCYLESTLQIGTIQEMVGDGSEAKAYLLWGKEISVFQSLPIFSVSFSAALGKLYRKQQLWDFVEKELDSATSILADDRSLISCLKCRLVLKVTVDQQFGDLFRTRFNSSTGNELKKGLSKAESCYRSAEENLKHNEWRNWLSNPKEASARNTPFCDAFLAVGNAVGISYDCGDQAEQSSLSKISGKETIESNENRKNKKITKPLPQEQQMNKRITRSSQQRSVSDALKGKGPQKVESCGCWHCLPSEIMKSLPLRNIIQMKWECIRRRLLLRLLTGRGKLFGDHGNIQRAHEVLLKSISVLVSRSTFHESHFSISFSFLADLIEKNVIGDIFVVEQGSILYNICWFSLKSFCDKRKHGGDSVIHARVVSSGLKLAFILCREVPLLFQKVSRLLAVL